MNTKTFILGIGLLIFGKLIAQPTITKAELFDIGEKITIQKCDSTGIDEGSSGANQEWDFSGLESTGSATTADIFSPEVLNLNTQYPNADRVEKWSDGKYVITSNTTNSSRLEAFIDSVNGISIQYFNPMLFAKRPITYGDYYSENFTTSYSFSGYDFKGVGIVEIEADGYGELKLPNGIYDNVLRIKMHQVEFDTLIQFGSVTQFETITYLWFDVHHSAALLKINYTITDTESKSVSYLVNQMVGTNDLEQSLELEMFPNPNTGIFFIQTTSDIDYKIFNVNGNVILSGAILKKSQEISLSDYPSGIYYVRIKDKQNNTQTKRIIKH